MWRRRSGADGVREARGSVGEEKERARTKHKRRKRARGERRNLDDRWILFGDDKELEKGEKGLREKGKHKMIEI